MSNKSNQYIFLDDSLQRYLKTNECITMLSEESVVLWFQEPSQVFKKLEESPNEQYDVIFLDGDLQEINPFDKNTPELFSGETFTRALRDGFYPELVESNTVFVIHSMNPIRAERMRQDLCRVMDDSRVLTAPYGSRKYCDILVRYCSGKKTMSESFSPPRFTPADD